MSPLYRESSSGKRRKNVRQLRRYLIVAEDSKSGLDYLLSFPHNETLVQIVSEGGAGNTLDVVDKGIEMRDEAARKGTPFVHVYCVFDKDDFPKERYHNAVEKAKIRNDVTAIWSNECFELWYLLHFEFRQTGIGRVDLRRDVEKHLKEKYNKADKAIYDKLKNRRNVALANSRRLYSITCQFTPRPWMENPCTNVHKLVEELIKLADIADLS
ncbi:MAG: RloB family protein [Kiritimatiellia bacterium]